MLTPRISNGVAVAIVALCAAPLVSAAALPLPSSSSSAIDTTTTATTTMVATVQAVTATIPTANAKALSPVPSPLPKDVKAFLDKFQPNAANAATQAIAANLRDFPNEGLCTTGYPCFSVSRVGMVNFDGQASQTVTQMDELLEAVLSMDKVTFNQASNPQTILSGTKIQASNLTLEVIAPTGSISSPLLVGTVFDLFKAQGVPTSSNAVRGVGVGGGPSGRSAMALCVYPSDAEGSTTTNFCHGRELDGTPSASFVGGSVHLSRRFSLEGLVSGFCSLIDIPILCPASHED